MKIARIKQATSKGYIEMEGMAMKRYMIVASRGRNPNNPSDRTAGAPTEQRLEINKTGVTNTLTSVQKDNLVLEIVDTVRIKQATKEVRR